jgi:transcriptional regulator with GAF, ATPase, and Fis domain
MIIATDADLIGVDQVPAEAREGGGGGAATDSDSGEPLPKTLKDLKTEAERTIVVASLERNDWHINRTAKELGLSDHASLLKIMRRLNLKRP